MTDFDYCLEKERYRWEETDQIFGPLKHKCVPKGAGTYACSGEVEGAP